MKKLILGILIILTSMSTLIGCNNQEEKEKKSAYTIGIVQLMEHSALDDAREGFVEKLDELGIDCTIDYKNAQGDIGVARTISEKFVTDGVDLIYAIATPAAEAAVGTGTDIPILFSAVTDPVSAHLVESLEAPGANVTGTSDAADIGKQLSLYKELDPNIKTIGIIYTIDEINSQVQVEEVEKLAQDYDLKVVTKGISNVSDLPQTAQSLIKDVDAMYIVSDNQIASSITLLADLLIENKMISICAEESQVSGGALLTNGIRYKDLGGQTAEMANKILIDGKSPSEIPVEKSNNTNMIVNKSTFEALNLDKNLGILEGAEYVGE